MARPNGKRMNGPAFRDVLRLSNRSMSEFAEEHDISLTTLSGLAAGSHGASDKMVATIADGLGVAHATLFPEVSNFAYDRTPVAV